METTRKPEASELVTAPETDEGGQVRRSYRFGEAVKVIICHDPEVPVTMDLNVHSNASDFKEVTGRLGAPQDFHPTWVTYEDGDQRLSVFGSSEEVSELKYGAGADETLKALQYSLRTGEVRTFQREGREIKAIVTVTSEGRFELTRGPGEASPSYESLRLAVEDGWRAAS